jgi:hypothetical protein
MTEAIAAMPVFLTKGQTIPLFASKSSAAKCDSIRVTAAWGAKVDLDLIAAIMKGSAISQSPMGMIYQADDTSARTLKIGDTLVATLLDDDLDGDNDASKALEACVVKSQNFVAQGYDSVVFGVFGYNGHRLDSMNATICIDMLDADKNVLEAKRITLENTNGTVAAVATAFFKEGIWYLKDTCETLGNSMTDAGLGEFWVGSQKVSAAAFVAA